MIKKLQLTTFTLQVSTVKLGAPNNNKQVSLHTCKKSFMHFLIQFSAITGIHQRQLRAVVFQDCQHKQPKSKDKGKVLTYI